MLAHRRNRLNRRAKDRRGAATVEFAVCLPIIVLLVMGSIEACSMIFLKQSLQTAAYESARTAIRTGSTRGEVTSAGENILDARNIEEYAITFPLGNPEAADRGDPVAVEVTASSAANSPISGRFIRDRGITVRTTMVKE